MANTQAMCSSFKAEILKGSHALGTQSANTVRTVVTVDVVKAALYLASATIGAATTGYSVTGEVTGTGYTAGGVAVTNATAPAVSGTGAIWTPSASITYSGVTLSTAFDSVLLYNDSSTGKLGISVHTFGSQTVTAGTFTLVMPANATGTALIQIV